MRRKQKNSGGAKKVKKPVFQEELALMFWITLRSIAASASNLATLASSSEARFSATMARPSKPST